MVASQRTARAAGRMPVRHRRPRWLVVTVSAVILAALIIVVTVVRHDLNAPLLTDDFRQPNGLVTNEFAYFNPRDPASVKSPVWLVTSGSLFARDHAGWTGIPGVGSPDPRSAAATDSSVFRAVTRDADLRDVAVSFGLLIQRFVTARGADLPSYQGVHVFLRYQSPTLLYVLSVDRRDGVLVIKKKVPGGTSNGGTYYTLAAKRAHSVIGRWEQVRVTAVNDGASVVLQIWLDGKLALQAIDSGAGDVAPITEPGRVGLRGDYTEFMFAKFEVTKS
jgi:hypothetical protein